MEEKELKYLDKLQTGNFVENAYRVKFSIEKNENYVILTELDNNGEVVVGAKKKKFTNESFNGLLANRHFGKTSTGRRILHGELESRLEFNKLVPK